MMTYFLRDIGSSFRWDSWTYNGPGAITRVLRNVCSTLEVTRMNAETCNGKLTQDEYLKLIRAHTLSRYLELELTSSYKMKLQYIETRLILHLIVWAVV